jgi:hypothetical protein
MNFTIKSHYFLVGPDDTIGFKSLKKLNKYCNGDLPAAADLNNQYHVIEVFVGPDGKLEARDLLWYEIDITGEWRHVEDFTTMAC